MDPEMELLGHMMGISSVIISGTATLFSTTAAPFTFLPEMHKGAKSSPTFTFTFCYCCCFIKAILLSEVISHCGKKQCSLSCFGLFCYGVFFSLSFLFLFSQIKYIGVTLVNKIVWISSVHLYGTLSVYCNVYF